MSSASGVSQKSNGATGGGAANAAAAGTAGEPALLPRRRGAVASCSVTRSGQCASSSARTGDCGARSVAAPPHEASVSTQAPNGASRAVGTHHGPTRIHVADYSLRHRRDGNTGTTILYHLRIYRRIHSLSVITTGLMELLEHGHRHRFRQGRIVIQGLKGRTEQRAD